jgi:hypothetical protein
MAVDKIVDHMSGIERARVTAPSRTTAYLRRGDTEQSINRIFSCTGSVQQREASHYAEIFIKAIHTVDSIRTRHCPIAVPDKRGSQRVKKHQYSGRTRERADGDCERHRQFHEGRYGSSR